MKTLITPPGFTRFYRIASAGFLVFLLAAVSVYFLIADDLTAGDVAFKLGYVFLQWGVVRVFLTAAAERNAAKPKTVPMDSFWD